MMQVSSEVSPTSCGARVKRTWKDGVLWTDSILKQEPLPDEVSVLRGTNGDLSIISQALNNMPLDGCPLEELGLAAQFAAEPAEPVGPAEEPGAGGAALADGADLERLGQEWNRVQAQTPEDGTRHAPPRADIGRDIKVEVPPPSIKVEPPSIK
eukprot:scaffold75434_cov45-Phaeocystis_antarctica.AAC.2